MKTEFVFNSYLENKIKEGKIIYSGDLLVTKGLADQLGTSYINLSCYIWNLFYKVSEDYLINEIGKSIVHETVHNLISREKIMDITDMEERACKILAGQKTEERSQNDKIETFK